MAKHGVQGCFDIICYSIFRYNIAPFGLDRWRYHIVLVPNWETNSC